MASVNASVASSSRAGSIRWTVSGAILADFTNPRTIEDKGKIARKRESWPIPADLVGANLAGLAGCQPADFVRLCRPTGAFLADRLAELPKADTPPVSASFRLSALARNEHLAWRESSPLSDRHGATSDRALHNSRRWRRRSIATFSSSRFVSVAGQAGI